MNEPVSREESASPRRTYAGLPLRLTPRGADLLVALLSVCLVTLLLVAILTAQG